MKEQLIEVVCEYCDEGEVKKIIFSSFRQYLQYRLAKYDKNAI